MNLKDYQEEAVEKLINIYHNSDGSTRPLFTAPTGAGKTIMVGAFIECLFKQTPNTCVIWLSIGKSGLHEQSSYKIAKFFPAVKSFTASSIISTNKQYLEHGDVLFLNWESISSKNKQGEWTNIFMRSSDKISFLSLVDNTKQSDIDIVLIIDEAHMNNSARTEEILDIIDSNFILNVTATPRKKQIKDAKFDIVKVEAVHVRDEGVIKKNILVNRGIRDNSDNIAQQLLEVAERRRTQLSLLYKKEQSKVNPLVIIQLPNGIAGDTLYSEVIHYLRKLDKTEENSKVAVWLTTSKINLEEIESIDAPQEYLIFKQAIDTGWDCPRSQILVKFRDIKSETFKQQVLGRILRMPELRHYNNNVLNDAYVFTNEEDFCVDKPEELPDSVDGLTYTIKIKSEFEDVCTYTILPSFKPLHNKTISISSKKDLLINLVKFVEASLPSFEETYKLRQSEVRTIIPTDITYSSVDGVLSVTGEKSVRITLPLLKEALTNNIKNVLKDRKEACAIMDYLLAIKPDETSLQSYLEMLLLNSDIIVSRLNLLVENMSTEAVSTSDLDIIYNNIPYILYVKNDPQMNAQYKKFLYERFPYQHCTLIEKRLIEELEKDEDVVWWFYNNTYSYCVGIPAIVDGKVSMYKPRFICKLKDNRTIVIDYSLLPETLTSMQNLLELWKHLSNLPFLGMKLINPSINQEGNSLLEKL